MSRALALLTLLTACSDYDLQGAADPTKAPDTDTGTFVPDTADTAVEDTAGDTGGTVIPDTGEVDTGDPEIATEPVYINSGSTLYGYDPVGNVATAIGVFKDRGVTVSDMTDIAIDLTGHMYGIAYEELYAITPATAEVRDLGSIGVRCNALTFVSDGTLVGAGDEGVITIDPTSLRTARIGGASYTSSGDIVGLPDGYLYWSVQGGANDDLVRVDPRSGKATRLGSIGVSGVFSLGYAYGELYGFTNTDKVVVIDASSGKATHTDRLTGAWWGATTNPVLW